MIILRTCAWANGTESTYGYDRLRERLQSMLLAANRDCIMETQLLLSGKTYFSQSLCNGISF